MTDENTIELELTQNEFALLYGNLCTYSLNCRIEEFHDEADRTFELGEKLFEQGYPQME